MQSKFILFITLFFAMAFSSPLQGQKMKKIFNGKNLKGWVVPENNVWWKAEKGVLSVENSPEKKGSNLWTQKEYGDFIVQADFKMGKGTVDSGIFLKGESPQIQIGISGSLKRDMTGSPYVPGKAYPVEATGVKELLKLDDWNTMKVQSKGKDIIVWLNDQQVMTYTVEKMAEKGPIGLQLHPGNEMSIEFRKIKVAEL
jgi:hypothetical protein